MKKIRKVITILASVSVVTILGFISYKYLAPKNESFGVEDLANYDASTAEKSAFEHITESLPKLENKLTQKISDTLELTMQFEGTSMSYRSPEGGDGTFCKGADWRKVEIRNTGKTNMVINNESFYYYIDDINRKFPTNVLENEDLGTYSFDSFPVVLEPGEEKKLILAFEYDFVGKRYPADSTVEQREAEIHDHQYFFKLSENTEEIKLEKMGLYVGCSSSEDDYEKIIVG